MTPAEPSPLESIIRRRRMTRTFDPRPIEHETIASMLDLARLAPSAGYSQGVHFLALSGEAVPTFWRITGGDEWFDDGVTAAPVVVVLILVVIAGLGGLGYAIKRRVVGDHPQ